VLFSHYHVSSGVIKMEKMKSQSIMLPGSNVEIRFAEEFDQEKLADLTRRLIVDEELATRMRHSPTEELSKVGIFVSDEERERITDEDILYALGHRTGPGEEGWVHVVVLIAIGTINQPGSVLESTPPKPEPEPEPEKDPLKSTPPEPEPEKDPLKSTPPEPEPE
jgi:hypothetical protein